MLLFDSGGGDASYFVPRIPRPGEEASGSRQDCATRRNT